MPIDLTNLKQKYEELKTRSMGGEVDFLKLKSGDNLVRFLCPPDSGDWCKETGYHYIKRESKVDAITCRKLTLGEECYVCDVVKDLRRSKNKADKDLAKLWSAKSRIFFNVLDRSDGKVKVLGTGVSIYKEILKYLADPDWGDITDPETGRDVIINKTGEDLSVVYSVMPKPNSKPLGVNLNELKLADFNSVVSVLSYEEQKQMLETGEISSSKEEVKQESSGDNNITKLLSKLNLDDPKIVKAVQRWKLTDGTEDGLIDLVNSFTEEEDSDEDDALKKALSRMKNK